MVDYYAQDSISISYPHWSMVNSKLRIGGITTSNDLPLCATKYHRSKNEKGSMEGMSCYHIEDNLIIKVPLRTLLKVWISALTPHKSWLNYIEFHRKSSVPLWRADSLFLLSDVMSNSLVNVIENKKMLMLRPLIWPNTSVIKFPCSAIQQSLHYECFMLGLLLVLHSRKSL